MSADLAVAFLAIPLQIAPCRSEHSEPTAARSMPQLAEGPSYCLSCGVEALLGRRVLVINSHFPQWMAPKKTAQKKLPNFLVTTEMVGNKN